jgi:hypothetical protein
MHLLNMLCLPLLEYYTIFLWNLIRIYDVAYHVSTGINIIQVKSQFQLANRLPSTVVRNPPCRSNATSRPVCAIRAYWGKLEVGARDSVGSAVVISCGETEKNHKFSMYLSYPVSMSRIDPVTQNIRQLVCRHVASLEECIRNLWQKKISRCLYSMHTPVQHAHTSTACTHQYSMHTPVQHAHTKKCATDPECYIFGCSVLLTALCYFYCFVLLLLICVTYCFVLLLLLCVTYCFVLLLLLCVTVFLLCIVLLIVLVLYCVCLCYTCCYPSWGFSVLFSQL